MPVWDAVQGFSNWFVRGFEDFWGIPHYEKGKVDAGEHFAKTMGAGLATAGAIAGVGYLAANTFGVAGVGKRPSFGGSLPMAGSAYKFPYGQQGSGFLRNNWWMKANVASRLLYPLAWLGVGAETSRRSLEYVGAWEQLGALSTERSLGYLAAQYQMYSALEAQRHANIVAQQQGAGMKDYQYRMYYNQSQGGYYYPRADSFGNAGMGW